METPALPWLDAAVGTIATIAVALLVVTNSLFALMLIIRRDRRFVDRWTKPLVVTDAALLVAAFGTPVVAIGLRLAAKGALLVAATAVKLVPGK